MKRALRSVAAVVLYLSAYWPVSASAIVPGSKITVTFEGLVKRTKADPIQGGYDGLDFDGSMEATGKAVYKQDPGFQAVIRGGVACVLPMGLQDSGSIRPHDRQNGIISIKSGHFAAFGGGVVNVTFNAFRKNVLVGTLFINQMKPQDNFIQFDKTFSNVDQFQIIGGVAFDNLQIKFVE